MSVATEVFSSSRSRPLSLKKRPDLVVVEQVYRNEKFWLIKDPLEMEFYRLNDEEYFVLSLIDGTRSLEELKSQFERRFPPQRIQAQEIQAFISDLHRKSLLQYSGGDVGIELIGRAKQKRWEKLKRSLSGILALKWRGVDPDRFLNWLCPRFGWLFSTPAVVFAVLLMLAASGWALVHMGTLVDRLPNLSTFLQPRNWLLLGSVVIVMKVLHELAHGLTFKRFGGECHEIGVMFLLFIPTLYCSTTDSWMLRSRWQRIAIAAAGMYVELVIAAVALFVWWFTKPGTLNMVCLNIIASGTISVLLINGNPFLKYDGYYILSDLLELPNMLERGGKVVQSYFLKYGLGIDEDAEPNALLSTKLWLVGFRLSSFVVRVLIVYLIAWMMVRRLHPYGLQYAGLAIGVLSAVLLLVPPGWSLYKFFKVPGRISRIEMKPALRTVVIALGVVALIFLVPFPHRITCAFTIKPRDGQALYVEHEAKLKQVFVEPAELVSEGQLIARLENLDTSLQLAEKQSKLDELRSELRLLDSTRDSNTQTVVRAAEIRVTIETYQQEITDLERIVESFAVKAPRDGAVLPEWQTPRRLAASEALQSWDGSPLSKRNLGTWMNRGEKLCVVGSLKQFDAVLAINEGDIALVRSGQDAVLMLDSNAGFRMTRPIESIAKKDAEELPPSLTKKNGGMIEVNAKKSDESEQKPEDEHFEARVPLSDFDFALSSGLRGTARVHVGRKTLFQRLWWKLNREFKEQL